MQKLINSELRYRRLFEAAQDGVLILDAETGMIEDVNPFLINMLGYSREEFVEKKLWEVGAFKDVEASQDAFEALRKNEYIRYEDLPLKTKDGRLIQVEFVSNVYLVGDKKVIQCNIRDITARKSAENAMQESEARYRRLFEAAEDGILILDAETGMIEDVNPFLINLLGYSRAEFVKKKLWEVGAFKDVEASQNAFEALQENEYIRYKDLPLRAKDGRMIQVEFVSNVYLVGNEKVIQCNIRDVTEHKRIIAALQNNENKYHNLVNQSSDGIFIIGSSGNLLTVNQVMCRELGFSEEEFLSMSIWDIIPEQYLDQYRKRLTKVLEGKSLEEAEEYAMRGKDGRIHYVEILSAPHYSGKDIVGFQAVARDITVRMQAEDALLRSETKFRRLVEHLPAVVYINTVGNTSSMLFISPQIKTLLGYTPQEWLDDPRLWSKMLHPEDRQQVLTQIASADQRNESFEMEYRMIARDGRLVWVHDQAALVNDLESQHQIRQGILLDITERKRADERIQRQLEHLTALSGIERAIASNFDLELSLAEILNHVTIELGIDAADILILNANSQMLEFAANRGFRTKTIRSRQVRLGGSYAGRAALERKLVQIPDLGAGPDSLLLATLLADDNFVSYFGVPLIAKGQVKGVLEIFHRAALDPDQEWFDFLNALAGQAAIAIEITTLFESLQRSNSQLTLAYDATIEGWSHALDLRDKETDGHTQRVTGMAVKLAHAFGLSEAELVQVRWGALLHDIGKMGVPDGILLKPGPLTHDEWVTMKKHPTFAYEMLAPIRYLRLALDIPYCHHEKWDGTGYPRGLNETQIPLVARIFAVVDVWDALTSDRPYRTAWREEKMREYMFASSGTHFDPQVVDVFIQMRT
jgi:PAS domain S-box-containing protein